MMPQTASTRPATAFDDNGRRVLRYADLRALKPRHRSAAASRDIELHLTGNMERFIWGFDGKKFSEAEPIRSSAASGCASC